MKLLKFLVVFAVAIFFYNCSGSDETPKPAADSLAVAANDSAVTVQAGENSVDLSTVPEDLKPMLREIQICLATAVDNSKTAGEGIDMMKKCEQTIREKFRKQMDKDPRFEQFFNEQGQQIYNLEKIRLKQKFNK